MISAMMAGTITIVAAVGGTITAAAFEPRALLPKPFPASHSYTNRKHAVAKMAKAYSATDTSSSSAFESLQNKILDEGDPGGADVRIPPTAIALGIAAVPPALGVAASARAAAMRDKERREAEQRRREEEQGRQEAYYKTFNINDLSPPLALPPTPVYDVIDVPAVLSSAAGNATAAVAGYVRDSNVAEDAAEAASRLKGRLKEVAAGAGERLRGAAADAPAQLEELGRRARLRLEGVPNVDDLRSSNDAAVAAAVGGGLLLGVSTLSSGRGNVEVNDSAKEKNGGSLKEKVPSVAEEAKPKDGGSAGGGTAAAVATPNAGPGGGGTPATAFIETPKKAADELGGGGGGRDTDSSSSNNKSSAPVSSKLAPTPKSDPPPAKKAVPAPPPPKAAEMTTAAEPRTKTIYATAAEVIGPKAKALYAYLEEEDLVAPAAAAAVTMSLTISVIVSMRNGGYRRRAEEDRLDSGVGDLPVAVATDPPAPSLGNEAGSDATVPSSVKVPNDLSAPSPVDAVESDALVPSSVAAVADPSALSPVDEVAVGDLASSLQVQITMVDVKISAFSDGEAKALLIGHKQDLEDMLSLALRNGF